MSRRPLAAANWKMYKTPSEAAAFVRELIPLLKGRDGADVVVVPAFPALEAAAREVSGTRIGLGAQDLFWEDEGAFTGQVSGRMLAAVGCRYVIIGHSERRQFFGETDETVVRKVDAAYRHGLTPIVCVGETLEQREAGETECTLLRQLNGGLGSLSDDRARTLVLAYEPVWAIGTGRTATPEIAGEAHALIRNWLSRRFEGAAEDIRILYGGSVKPDNARTLFSTPDIDGGLIGGASLKAESFAAIVTAAKA
ncbi:MAG: triose-phosphate isomerase [Nitrospirae bacterium]|nr:triose-phosphate isomerase [Nitrospirota bacterium]MBI3392413.1 triose-phosphate isomerase [Nitrospirota bacterium]